MFNFLWNWFRKRKCAETLISLGRIICTLDAAKPLKILHKSQHFVVVEKDFDVFTNNEIGKKRSVHTEMAKAFPDLVNRKLRHLFYFPHRLDYATSGILCLALSRKACAAASAAFENGLCRKFYLAIVRGHVSKELVDIRMPIGEDSSENAFHKMCTIKNKHCVSQREARTRILVLEKGFFMGYPSTKVLIRPVSGRRHQIRVHCSYLGHTIVGDYTYSGRKDVCPERTYLHAFRLILNNDVEPLDIRTEDPFTELHLSPNWIPVETVNTLNGGIFLKLMSEEIYCAETTVAILREEK